MILVYMLSKLLVTFLNVKIFIEKSSNNGITSAIEYSCTVACRNTGVIITKLYCIYKVMRNAFT